MKTIIHVNQHIIKSDKKSGKRTKPITVKNYKSNRKTNRVDIIGKDGDIVASVVYPDKQLSCGASVWIETTNEVKVS